MEEGLKGQVGVYTYVFMQMWGSHNVINDGPLERKTWVIGHLLWPVYGPTLISHNIKTTDISRK